MIDNEERERVLLAQLINNPEVFIKAITFLDRSFFDSKTNKLIVKFMISYYDKYKEVPPSDAILIDLDMDETRANWLDVSKLWPTAYLEDYLNAFIRNMSMKNAIEESIELLETEDYGEIEKKIKEAVSIDLDVKLGVTVNTEQDEFKTIFDMITSKELTAPTGWDNVDKHLDGGVTIPSLNYVLAKSGGGKSIALVNLAWNYVQQGKDVVYVSLELKEPKIMKRYISHSTKINSNELHNRELDIFNHFKKCEKRGYGRFTVHFYQPNTLTSMKLELFIRSYIQKYGVIPVIIVDYAGLMIPNGKGWQGAFERDKYVSEELRGVATLFNTIIWTADQYNRCIEIGEKVITPQGEKKIGDLKVGDQVLGTNNEWRNVLDVTEPEEQDVYEIVTKSGKKIMVSGRHLIPKLLENGKTVEDNIDSSLKVGDKIFVVDALEQMT